MADATTDFLLGLDQYRREHHVTCNHRAQLIGGPGCICEVVNKHEQRGLEAALEKMAKWRDELLVERDALKLQLRTLKTGDTER